MIKIKIFNNSNNIANAIQDLDFNKEGNRVAMVGKYKSCLITDVDSNAYLSQFEQKADYFGKFQTKIHVFDLFLITSSLLMVALLTYTYDMIFEYFAL